MPTFVLVPVSAQTQPGTGSADARLRALYTEEWNWRQQELARDGGGGASASDRFPSVDAASQQARLAYWTRTLTALDSNPFDELSPENSAGIVATRRRSWAPSSTSDTSTMPSWRSARFRCRCWSSGWRSSSPLAA